MSSGVVCLSLPESFLLVRHMAWGGLERKEGDQEAKFVILISIQLLNLISLVSVFYMAPQFVVSSWLPEEVCPNSAC